MIKFGVLQSVKSRLRFVVHFGSAGESKFLILPSNRKFVACGPDVVWTDVIAM